VVWGENLHLPQKLRKYIYLEWPSLLTYISKYLSCIRFCFYYDVFNFNIEQLVVKKKFQMFLCISSSLVSLLFIEASCTFKSLAELRSS